MIIKYDKTNNVYPITEFSTLFKTEVSSEDKYASLNVCGVRHKVFEKEQEKFIEKYKETRKTTLHPYTNYIER